MPESDSAQALQPLREDHVDGAALRPRAIRALVPRGSLEKGVVFPVVLFLAAFSAYAATWFFILKLVGAWKLVLSVLNGLLIAVIFIIGHDACHQSYTRFRWLNHLVGRIAFMPMYNTYCYWDLGHNRGHHVWTNLQQIDYGWAPFSKEQFDRLRFARRLLERAYRQVWGMWLWFPVEIWWKHMIMPRREDLARVNRLLGRIERLSVLVYLLTQAVAAFVLESAYHPSEGKIVACVNALAFGVIVPNIVWSFMMGFVTFQHHTHERVRWFDDKKEWSYARGTVAGTVRVVYPRIIELALLDIFDHIAHHVDPHIPLYKLHGAQAALQADERLDIVVHAFGFRAFRNTLNKCKLYDYRNCCWLDFDGNRTTLPAK